jgi:hypothetical protein
MLTDTVKQDVSSKLNALVETEFLGDKPFYSTLFEELRSSLMPSNSEKYVHTSSYQYEIFDPTPINSCQRALAGFMSSHYMPQDKFFKYTVPLEDSQDPDLNLNQILSSRAEKVHSILQQPSNFSKIFSFMRDKLVLGVGVVVVEKHNEIISQIVHHMPENCGFLSSNGSVHDITFIREKLNQFQASVRFPDLEFDGESDRISDNTGEWYYRLNIPKNILLKYLSVDKNKKQDNEYYKYIEKTFGKKLLKKNEKGDFLDIWFCQRGVLSVNEIRNKRIIVSFMQAPNDTLGIGRGQGELALPIFRILTELEIINLSGYERTFMPSWAVSDEPNALSFDLTRDHINFIDADSKAPQPLSLNSDVRAMVEFKNYKQALFDRILYLDAFQLLNKSRMTTDEVDIRRQDAYRNLGPFISEDEDSFLNPLNRAILDDINAVVKKADRVSIKALQATYTSPLAFSARESVFTKASQIFRFIKEGAEVEALESEVGDVVDIPEYITEALITIGETNAIRSIEEKTVLKGMRESRKKVALQQQQAEALRTNSEAIKASSVEQ